MIVSLSLGLLLITGLTHSLPYPQEMHVQNIDQLINASTNQSSSTITTQSPEIMPIELNVDHEHDHHDHDHHDHDHDHKEKMNVSQDNQNSGRSLDSTSNYNSNTGLLTSIFLNPAVRPTEQSHIAHDDSMTTKSDESSTDSIMVKDQNDPMIMNNNDTMIKMITENINNMEEMHHVMNETEIGKELIDGQNDQPIMDDVIMPENINENIGQNHNTENGNRKYIEINRDNNQYIPNNNDNQYLPINHHNDNQYLPINNHNDHQYSTVDNVYENRNHENHREHENNSDEEDIQQSHADIKASTEIKYDYTEKAMEIETTTSVISNVHDNKSDNDNNKIDIINIPKTQESKPSSGNKLDTIYKFGKITLLLYITFICL